MSSDVDEYEDSALFLEYRAVVAGHVDASAARKTLLDGVVVEKWMKWFGFEQS